MKKNTWFDWLIMSIAVIMGAGVLACYFILITNGVIWA